MTDLKNTRIVIPEAYDEFACIFKVPESKSENLNYSVKLFQVSPENNAVEIINDDVETRNFENIEEPIYYIGHPNHFSPNDVKIVPCKNNSTDQIFYQCREAFENQQERKIFRIFHAGLSKTTKASSFPEFIVSGEEVTRTKYDEHGKDFYRTGKDVVHVEPEYIPIITKDRKKIVVCENHVDKSHEYACREHESILTTFKDFIPEGLMVLTSKAVNREGHRCLPCPADEVTDSYFGDHYCVPLQCSNSVCSTKEKLNYIFDKVMKNQAPKKEYACEWEVKTSLAVHDVFWINLTILMLICIIFAGYVYYRKYKNLNNLPKFSLKFINSDQNRLNSLRSYGRYDFDYRDSMKFHEFLYEDIETEAFDQAVIVEIDILPGKIRKKKSDFLINFLDYKLAKRRYEKNIQYYTQIYTDGIQKIKGYCFDSKNCKLYLALDYFLPMHSMSAYYKQNKITSETTILNHIEEICAIGRKLHQSCCVHGAINMDNIYIVKKTEKKAGDERMTSDFGYDSALSSNFYTGDSSQPFISTERSKKSFGEITLAHPGISQRFDISTIEMAKFESTSQEAVKRDIEQLKGVLEM